MSPEEKVLLERTLKLSEENNKILRKMQRTARLAVLWGFIKVAIIVVPLVIGYLYLEPYLGQALDNFNSIKELLNTPR
ncbi:MAG: hypothetical protein A3G05_01165 [Candidatus Zambryskibacteria bacterium RIFCSPLOWO2_12_FULL_45_14]|uniref:Uncharacterized protein n=2 Tax=Candidatus Zambryskiibacteriota TaxID=1817925 RepID=A0A1G2UK94_9BACT|nr:MAG: hypothetical protein A3H60_00715 [Candidatus Zambryskibacteria bacterium RIFCSPLOWO2_02_FULL_44_12b]OHB14268.1 MAG: hypothetical protein A3G05_01165 [Candidatus Zambryskibacteria bacterium RIFCSPLOWO2_12_FULL_45_14]